MRKKKTAPRTRKHRKTSSSKKLGLIVRKKNAQQSAKTESALDNHFHRTALPVSCGPLDASKMLSYLMTLLPGHQLNATEGPPASRA